VSIEGYAKIYDEHTKGNEGSSGEGEGAKEIGYNSGDDTIYSRGVF